LNRQGIEIGPGQARAAEQEIDLVIGDIGRDGPPQAIDHGAPSIVRIDAGTSEFEAGVMLAQKRREVELVRRIEAVMMVGDRTAHEPEGADHGARDVMNHAPTLRRDHQQMIAKPIEPVDVPTQQLVLERGGRPHLLIENAVAQRLRLDHLPPIPGQPHHQVFAREVSRSNVS
jgi:hypothetical protein